MNGIMDTDNGQKDRSGLLLYDLKFKIWSLIYCDRTMSKGGFSLEISDPHFFYVLEQIGN